ncbi:MAG: BMP family ABC transporter substrate-binding protein [Firmicutes bacterium]|nr:BMP family ABC transporter substrate-binding protein [Bacillota bacterium]
MKKRLFAVLLAGAMAFSLAACGSKEEEKAAEAVKEAVEEVKEDAEADTEEEGSGVTLDNIKIGFVHVSDPSDMGYTYNHDKGTQKMKEDLGLRDDQIINKYNTPEGAECETAVRELVEAGCNIIFCTSFGHEDYMLLVAEEYPDVQFCHATGYQAASSGLDNVHNYFGRIYQARYLSGIAAGLKTQTNKLGYVSAMPFAECISGYTAFYLGAKSVNPDVTMMVGYTNSWNDPTVEAQVAQSLIDQGCDVIGQHADSTATQTTAEANGVWGVGYNSDMIAAAPNAVLTSAIWDWSIYLEYAVNCVVNGEPIAVDWCGSYEEGMVGLSPLNENTIAEGTQEAIDAASQQLLDGYEVFSGPLYDADGNVLVEEGDFYPESGEASAPSWDKIIDGITILG